MGTVFIREAKNPRTDLARCVEKGKSFVVTCNDKPVLELVPPKKQGGINFEAGKAYLQLLRIKGMRFVTVDRALADHPVTLR